MNLPLNDTELVVGVKPMHNLYIAVDACADLGGQPYKVLEALHHLYGITKRRNLRVIDTEQGFHEKANCVNVELLNTHGSESSLYGRFVSQNSEWTDIIATSTCSEFRAALAHEIFPQMVDPMIQSIERTMQNIRETTYGLLQSRGESTLDGKPIATPSDVDIRIEYNVENQCVFRSDVVNEAADRVLDYWRGELKKNPALDDKKMPQDEKAHMLAMIKSLQEMKAFTHRFMSKLHPGIATEMGAVPELFQSNDFPTLSTLRKNSHLYEQMSLPAMDNRWHMPEMIQAVRMTTLWPWTQQEMLTESARQTLKKRHKNTADLSYLNLYANILPTMTDPENSLFILLSHDVPLREQFLECATGLRQSKQTVRDENNGTSTKQDVYRATPIYDELHLTKRAPHEYPKEAVWVGSEFAEFTYKEILAALAPYITNKQRREWREDIRKNGFGAGNKVGESLTEALGSLTDVPQELKSALEGVLVAASGLERHVKRDIRLFGVKDKSGNYFTRKLERQSQQDSVRPLQ